MGGRFQHMDKRGHNGAGEGTANSGFLVLGGNAGCGAEVVAIPSVRFVMFVRGERPAGALVSRWLPHLRELQPTPLPLPLENCSLRHWGA